MITYISKDEFKATFASGKWHTLYTIAPYSGLMFDTFYYRIGDKIYGEDCAEARDAYEKELIWQKLQKKDPILIS